MSATAERLQELMGCGPEGVGEQFCRVHPALPDGTELRRIYWTDEGCPVAAAMADDPSSPLVALDAAPARVGALIDSTWPIPREAMGAFVIPRPVFDSAQRNALRAALAGEAS